LEQCIRRICLTGTYQAKVAKPPAGNEQTEFRTEAGAYYSAQQVLQNYCRFLYDRLESFEAVARIAGLDSRTVKKYLRLDR